MTRGLKLYFSQIEIVGLDNIPNEKPFILAVNHQNALLDALVSGLLIPRDCYFLARADIFNGRTRWILETLKVTPIYRFRDGYDQLSKNKEAFQSCTDLFAAGHPIVIAPEGNHAKEYYLRPLTKGVARIALQSEGQLNTGLMIVPCGLNYFSHRTPRRKVVSVYGAPIAVSDFLDEYQQDKRSGLVSLTTALSTAMKECLVIPELTADYHEKSIQVFSPENTRLSFAQLRRLAAGEFHPSDQIDPRPGDTVDGGASTRFLLALTSLANIGPLFILKRILGRFRDRVFWASLKFVFMLFAMPIWWLILFAVGYLIAGWIAGASLVTTSLVSLFLRSAIVTR